MAREKCGNGYLGRNKWKKEDHQPEYTGKAKVAFGGKEVELELGAWIKEGKDGGKFFSISFSAEAAAPPEVAAKADDDDVPF